MLTLYPVKGRLYSTVGEILNDWNAGVYFTRDETGQKLVSRQEVEYQGCTSIEFRFNGKRRKSLTATFEGGVWS